MTFVIFSVSYSFFSILKVICNSTISSINLITMISVINDKQIENRLILQKRYKISKKRKPWKILMPICINSIECSFVFIIIIWSDIKFVI